MAVSADMLFANISNSYRPLARDQLTGMFLRSNATHLLWVNSDMGWAASDVHALVLANTDFITGIYAKKGPEGAPAAAFLERREGDLIEVLHTGAGFMLLRRSCVERMVAAHPELVYDTPEGPLCALWAPQFDGHSYSEERTFCAHWRALGGTIWAHSQVVLKRFGETVFMPEGFARRVPGK